MRSKYMGVLSMVAVLGLVSVATAVPYASGVVQNGASSSFVLNEDGANVQIVFDGGATVVDMGTLGKGTHSFDATQGSSYQIKVSKSAAAGWTQISNDALTQSKYFSPRGVSINKNSASSNFGRIYVGEGLGGAVAAGGRTTTDGIYAMTADQGDVLGQGDTAFAGGINWTTGGSNSPWKVTVAPDDTVYIADWSDLNSGVWRCNANPQANFDEILTNAGRTSTGLVAGVHGSVASVYIEGTGANTVLYTLDEDFDAGSGMGSILRYDIGTQTGYSGTPSEQTQDIPNYIANSNMDVVRDSDGSWWICQYRYTDSDSTPTLLHWADGASSPSWTSGPSTVALDRGYGILAIDNLNDLIAVGTNNSKIFILDISDPSNIALVDTIAHSGATIRDLDFDAAGNLYVVSSSSETLRIYSPGGDWMAITGSDGSFALIPEPAAIALLALGGLACLRRRRAA